MPRLIGVFVECTTIFLVLSAQFDSLLWYTRDRKTNSVDIDKTLQYASHLGLHCLSIESNYECRLLIICAISLDPDQAPMKRRERYGSKLFYMDV